MLAVQILIAFCVALVLTLLLFRKWPRRRSGETMKNSVFGALAVIFLIIFAMSWAGGVWAPSFGPQLYGVSWLSFFVVGLITALILATAARPMGENPAPPEGKPQRGLRGLGFFFWVLMLVLVVVGVVSYYQPDSLSFSSLIR